MNKYIVLRLLCLLLSLFSFAQAMIGSGKRPIDQLFESKDHVSEQCAICREEEENPRLEALPCGHTFHAQCLDAYIKNAFGANDTNFDQLKCPHFSSHHSSCEGVLTREKIDDFTSSSSSSSSAGAPGNAAILAFFDQRTHERANPTAIVVTPADAAELAAIAAGHLQICPGCNSRANRIDGCNHMICTSNEGGCGTHYCYPCGTPYNPAINGGRGWEARACACPHFPGGPMALIEAAQEGHLEIVQELIGAAGVQVNAADDLGSTALDYAAQQGHLAVVQELIAVPGIQLNRADVEGMTPLHGAAQNSHLGVVTALINAGADLNTVDVEGWAALHYAAKNGDLEIVQALIDAGAHVNTADNEGWTALHNAALYGHLPIVQKLILAGVHVNRQNAEGRTALYYAESIGRREVVKLLQKTSSEK